ncbi:Hypothetical protein R9X50_00397800 [Acrodontium crateriforme]|uniref:DH domain-containing protein n=1 Tax=Acrodontium crateriforme TaxID=150365 RepID=A0AAQ3M4K8_9PEZI|nr:Hypothetical protein R9X50_00397800 [Acrodontium crateriforme]
MSASINGPLAYPFELYPPFSGSNSPSYDTPSPLPEQLHSLHNLPATVASRSMSTSPPARTQARASSGPQLNNARSHPVLAQRPPGSVMNIATMFDQSAGAEAAQAIDANSGPKPDARSRSGSVMSNASARQGQRRRPSHVRSSDRFLETMASNGSQGPNMCEKRRDYTHSPKDSRPSTRQANAASKPLFGEITPDGSFLGDYSVPGYEMSSYEIGQDGSNSYYTHGRRQSESSALIEYGRYPSQQDPSSSAIVLDANQILKHKRSRSDMDPYRPQQPPSLPNLLIPNTILNPVSQKQSQGSRVASPTTRIPVSNQRYKSDDDLHLRSTSTLSKSPARNRNQTQKSPTRRKPIPGKENAVPGAGRKSRYQPPSALNLPSSHMLSAKIVAPPPKTSPPLRSSRPRQPVSSATTSASRARAAQRFQGANSVDSRRPSEQWLGKPYDGHKERSRRKIPELSQVDFAERRARIQHAINKNLDRSRSQESRKSSRQRSFERGAPNQNAVEDSTTSPTGQRSANVITEDMNTIAEQHCAEDEEINNAGNNIADKRPEQRSDEPQALTRNTGFDDVESPILGKFGDQTVSDLNTSTDESLPLLSAAIYYAHSLAQTKTPSVHVEAAEETEAEKSRRSSLLENVMRMRQRSPSDASRSGTEFADESGSASAAEDSPSDIEGRWGLSRGPNGDQGSIKIMLDDAPSFHTGGEHRPSEHILQASESARHANTTGPNHLDFTHTIEAESPIDMNEASETRVATDTPQLEMSHEETLKPVSFNSSLSFMATSESLARNEDVSRMLDQYQSADNHEPDNLRHMQHHMSDSKHNASQDEPNDERMQDFLDGVVDPQTPHRSLQFGQYQAPLVTPDTPPDAAIVMGTALVYSTNASLDDLPTLAQSEEDFAAKVKKADEEWDRRQQDSADVLRASHANGPTPPPKDFGYTPRSSVSHGIDFSASIADGLRMPTDDNSKTAGNDVESTQSDEKATSIQHSHPPPDHAPPLPPFLQGLNVIRRPLESNDNPRAISTYSERESGEMSPRLRKNLWGPTDSSRPSMDSQRIPGIPPVPGSLSMSSLPALSTRTSSVDTGGDSTSKLTKTSSATPEQKRLSKRRHIIKELLDTENTYHQDLKIIEDIYKATVADLVSADDKKTLFGNCDEIERFSLRFYDELRKAVSSVYIPPKQMRWLNKRESQSTTHSDHTGQASFGASSTVNDTLDDAKDRTTTVGQIFLNNLQQMDQVYGIYLKNHDAANQRLSALKHTTPVKCWLDECHNNASDITSAWDLDSLLVKPTQRVSKYPMLLQQLLETTPPDHPDHEALKAAAKDTVNMLTRINDAKKRADIVDQIINRKTKDTDVRSGIAKAFGRRTDKLKERVGIAEAYQDKEFDDLVHRFGGHYIRLQICMRDVQDYLQRIDKSMEQINNCASALELFTDVNPSSLPEIESKWRRYGQAIREIVAVAFPDHKTAVQKRVIDPMITCIKLHQGPQNAINQRKKRILDFAKCQAIEKRGEKPDKKTLEASEMYIALNEHLKLELPKLYSLTASLVQSCLTCFLDIQLTWYNVWERKLRPTIDAIDIPASIQHIEPAFKPDYDLVKDKLTELGICNGSLLADSANFLVSTTTLTGDSDQSFGRPPSISENSKRTRSVGSESSPNLSMTLNNKRNSGYCPPAVDLPLFLGTEGGRIRSNSSYSNRGTPSQTPNSGMLATPPSWSSSTTPNNGYASSRPETATSVVQQSPYQAQRANSDNNFRTSRPSSSTNYAANLQDNQRFSGIFNSALPTGTPESTVPPSPKGAPDDTPVMFVCASLFEFSIDKTRREAGYPYLTYVQGEVFDVVAQKGELWLAKNQDDATNSLGWIWEQHFVILSGE